MPSNGRDWNIASKRSVSPAFRAQGFRVKGWGLEVKFGLFGRDFTRASIQLEYNLATKITTPLDHTGDGKAST